MRVPARRRAVVPAIAVVAAVVLLVGLPGGTTSALDGARRATPLDWPIGADADGGFMDYTSTTVQYVLGAAYYDTFCATSKSCMHPGAVAYIPGSDVVILTETTDQGAGQGDPGVNAVVLFNANTLAGPEPILLHCQPGAPLYPGTGVYFFVPCLSPAIPSIFTIDYQTDSIVANLSVPLPGIWGAMAYNPSTDDLYISSPPGEVATINTSSERVVGVTNLTNVSFTPAFPVVLSAYWYDIAYDSVTSSLIVPSATGGLLSFNPTTWTVTSSVSLPETMTAVAVSPATGQVFAATLSGCVATVFTLNALSLASLASISVGGCSSDAVDQILVDPGNGDAYVSAATALEILNLSSLNVVGSVADYGAGPPASVTFSGAVDRVFGTFGFYPRYQPGFLIQLQHGVTTTSVLTGFLWLPAEQGIILAAALVGAAAAFSSFRSRGRSTGMQPNRGLPGGMRAARDDGSQELRTSR